MIATTGIGLRGWIAAADGWGLADELTDALAQGTHGLPRTEGHRSAAGRRAARGVVTGIGVLPRGGALPASSGGIAGLRIAVQLHGATDEWDPFPEFLDELRPAGAEVVPIRVYRWRPSPRDGAFDAAGGGHRRAASSTPSASRRRPPSRRC